MKPFLYTWILLFWISSILIFKLLQIIKLSKEFVDFKENVRNKKIFNFISDDHLYEFWRDFNLSLKNKSNEN